MFFISKSERYLPVMCWVTFRVTHDSTLTASGHFDSGFWTNGEHCLLTLLSQNFTDTVGYEWRTFFPTCLPLLVSCCSISCSKYKMYAGIIHKTVWLIYGQREPIVFIFRFKCVFCDCTWKYVHALMSKEHCVFLMQSVLNTFILPQSKILSL